MMTADKLPRQSQYVPRSIGVCPCCGERLLAKWSVNGTMLLLCSTAEDDPAKDGHTPSSLWPLELWDRVEEYMEKQGI